jgi:hypothetical protein
MIRRGLFQRLAAQHPKKGTVAKKKFWLSGRYGDEKKQE